MGDILLSLFTRYISEYLIRTVVIPLLGNSGWRRYLGKFLALRQELACDEFPK
jgi:hypothetical protein